MLQWIRTRYFSVFKTAALMGVLLAAVLLLILPAFSVVGAGEASAQIAEGVAIVEEPLGLPSLDIRVIIANIIRAILGLLGLILLIILMYAGYLYMTAGGNDEQIGTAKAMIKNAIIGLAIILSAYSIVLFVMSMLGIKFNDNKSNLNPPGTVNFVGSGALGKIIKDHYPMRDQVDVWRNTKIVVTFRKPIVLDATWIEEKSGDTIFGNCKPVVVDWNNDCDQVKTLDNNYLKITRVSTSTSATADVLGAVILAEKIQPAADLPHGVYTIVLKPITNEGDVSGGYLGSEFEAVKYNVRLGGEIRLDDEGNDFPRAITPATAGDNHYDWNFITTTTLDLSPPTVVGVYPDRDEDSAPRNSVIQIDFSEPIDPIGVQGAFSPTSSYFKLFGDNVFLNTGNSTTVPAGNFVLTNGYRTLEFTPTQQCAVNACGLPIYCLPADSYEILLRAGQVLSTSSFMAMPFTGVMDLASNALDGHKNSVVEEAENVGDVFSATPPSRWKQPDNDWWDFTITNTIDTSTPFLINIHPGLDAENVPANEPLKMTFNKRMQTDPLYGIEIKEIPAQTPSLCKWPIISDDHKSVDLRHCPFLDAKKQDYAPIITSAVVDVNFNCFYPGQGPGAGSGISGNNNADEELDSRDCRTDGTDCCKNISNAIDQAFCCNGEAGNSTTTAQCLATF